MSNLKNALAGAFHDSVLSPATWHEGRPVNPKPGDTYFDDDDDKFWQYDGSRWRSMQGSYTGPDYDFLKIHLMQYMDVEAGVLLSAGDTVLVQPGIGFALVQMRVYSVEHRPLIEVIVGKGTKPNLIIPRYRIEAILQGGEHEHCK